MSSFAGNHVLVTRNTPNINYQETAGGPGRDVSVDGHGTVVPGFLDEWTANATVAAVLRSFGWDGKPFGNDSREAFEYLRQHSVTAGRQSMLRDIWETAGREGLLPAVSDGNAPGAPLHVYPGAPPLTGYDSVYDRLHVYGLIDPTTPLGEWTDPGESMGTAVTQRGLAQRYFENKLVPPESMYPGAVSEVEWMLEHRGLRPLPEEWPVREDGLYLFDALEKRIAEWGLAAAITDAGQAAANQKAAELAYEAFEDAFVPASDEGASPSYGIRTCNPRSVLNRGRMIENAIVQGDPTRAAVKGVGCALMLGTPQHFSRFEMYGFKMDGAPLQADEWKYLLNMQRVGGAGAGLWVGGKASG